MKILITGGSGMVGRNLSRYLQAESFQLHAPIRGELDLRNRPAVEDHAANLAEPARHPVGSRGRCPHASSAAHW